MNNVLQNAASLAGRIMIVVIFAMSALGNKIPNFSSVADYMTAEGVPASQVMLVGAIAFLLVGSVSIVAGYRTRFGATLLLVFLTLATYYFHDFWTFDGDARNMQMIHFLKNLSMMGTMVFLIANGPGACSLDHYLANSAAAREAV